MVPRLPVSWSNWNLEVLVFEERGVLEIIASLWRENSSRDLKTELCMRVFELCSRSE